MNFLVLCGLSILIPFAQSERHDYGHRVGVFREYSHGIKGTVYAVDGSTFFIDGFFFDGKGPEDVYFWVGKTDRPSPEGSLVPYPTIYKGVEPPPLKAHNNTSIILTLPDGKKIKDIKWLAVWCRRFTINYGEVFMPANLKPPHTRALSEFKRIEHGVRSGNITILDSKTIYIPNLHYDGRGPDTYFLVGKGPEPSQRGTKVPNEVGSLDVLKAYNGDDIELQLPGNMQVYDIDWLAIFCLRYQANFGHVMIPKDLDVPPSLGQTKIHPPWWYNPTSSTTPSPNERKEMKNCREMLAERLQVRWEIKGAKVQIQLSAAIRIDQYIAFGISGESNRPSMIGSDIAVVFYDSDTGKFYAKDYYISATGQCDGSSGVCPDEKLQGINDISLVYGERRHGVTTIIYERPLRTADSLNDRPIILGNKTNVIAAIGPLNYVNEPNAHSTADKSMENTFIDFGISGDYACAPLSYSEIPEKPWPKSSIQNTYLFSVRTGPSGGRRGYAALTKRPSLGVSWYVNGKLIPEIHVERGKTYTFMVEGGNNPEHTMRYHPFYITDNREGAFDQKTEEEQKNQRVFAGISYDSEGNPLPNTAGRFCEWAYKTTDQIRLYDTFEDFFKTLELRCDPGQPAYLNWTVAFETPSVVYYQCYVHPYMGWKILVHDPVSNKLVNDTDNMGIHVANYVPITYTGLMFYFIRYMFYF